MRFVSPLLKRAVYPALHHSGALNWLQPLAGYTVVNYHGVVPADHFEKDPFLDGNLVQPQTFRKQLQFLKSRYHLIDPEEFRSFIEQGKTLPPRAILLTCDDGLLNTVTDMLPILQSEAATCLFLVTTASCGDDPGMLWYEELFHLMRNRPLDELAAKLPNENIAQANSHENFQTRWWSIVRRASKFGAEPRAAWMRLVRTHCGPTQASSEKRWRLLNLQELKQLSNMGMSIGAHTRTHPVLSLCDDEEARREISESKIEIERALGQPVWAFAYPFGNPSTMGGRECRLAQEAGFSCAFLNVADWPVRPVQDRL